MSTTNEASLTRTTPNVLTVKWPEVVRYRHLLFYFSAALLCNFCASVIIGWWFAPNAGPATDVVFASMAGFVVGQCVVLAVLGGLYGSSWIDGFWIGCFVAALGLLLMILAVYIIESLLLANLVVGRRAAAPPEAEVWSLLLCVPGAVFALCSPLLVLRHFAKWRLIVPDRKQLKLPSGLSQIFISTALIAGILVALRCPQVMGDFDTIEFWLVCLGTGAVGAIISAIVTIPLAANVNCEDPFVRMVRLGVLSLIGMIVLGVIIFVASIVLESPVPWSAYALVFTAAFVATITVFIGFTAIRRDGLRLQTRTTERALERTLTVDDLVEGGDRRHELALSRYRKRTLWSVGFFVLGVIGLSVFVGRFGSGRDAFEQAMIQLEEIAANADGDIDQYGYGDPINGFLHAADSEQVQRFLEPLIETKTKIQILNLSGCSIDDASLTQIGQLKGLSMLNLSDTKVTGQRFSKLAGLPDLHTLELKNSDLTQADWMSLPTTRLTELLVDGSKVTQTDLADFLGKASIFTLDVGGMAIGEELKDAIVRQAGGRLRRLEMAGTEVDDRFVSRLKDSDLTRLNLSRTKVTDAVFDALVAMMPELSDLDLSGTAITDAGLARLGSRWPLKDASEFLDGPSLYLGDTNVTGEFLIDWKNFPRKLDLSGTKIDDTLVDLLPAASAGDWLDLSNTQITDAILAKLARRDFRCVNIADTKLTAKALTKAFTDSAKPGLTKGVKLWLAGEGQFTPNEMKRFEKVGVPVRVPQPVKGLVRSSR